MVPMSIYIFIYGVPVFTIIFSVFLYGVLGKRVFDSDNT